MSVLEEIIDERHSQDRKWGEQNHEPLYWLAILMEELGEAAQIVIDDLAGITAGNYRAELVQVAAVAVSAIESWDRSHLQIL